LTTGAYWFRVRSMKHGLFVHGRKATPEYNAWSAMHSRCTDKNNEGYHRYGGRGIKVCKRWKSFANFISDMGKRPDGFTLERINTNKGYSRKNCKWATPLEQANNRRSNKLVLFRGQKKTVAQWCRELSINWITVKKRIAAGWKIDKAFMQPIRSYKHKI
jgi:hypothetical protein